MGSFREIRVFGVLDQSVFLETADKFLVGDASLTFAFVKAIDIFQILVEQFRSDFGDLIHWHFLPQRDVGESSVVA